MGTCLLMWHFRHSRRRTNFFVVLACNRAEKPIHFWSQNDRHYVFRTSSWLIMANHKYHGIRGWILWEIWPSFWGWVWTGHQNPAAFCRIASYPGRTWTPETFCTESPSTSGDSCTWHADNKSFGPSAGSPEKFKNAINKVLSTFWTEFGQKEQIFSINSFVKMIKILRGGGNWIIHSYLVIQRQYERQDILTMIAEFFKDVDSWRASGKGSWFLQNKCIMKIQCTFHKYYYLKREPFG